jgi:hypothetical protein
MMRNWSNLYLTAVLGGLTVSVLLLGAIRARNEGPARVIAVSEHSKVRTHTISEHDSPANFDLGAADLRGSLP